MVKYKPSEIESHWQHQWEKSGSSAVDFNPSRPKFYALTMLPYPSGDLHIGHWYAMAPSDARARFKRMKGFNVLFPMGFDAFGLPAENAAIKHGVHPREWTYSNIERMRRQLRRMGAMFDWRREIVSSDPSYYRWTQWLFLRLLRAGLAYQKRAGVDWCPSCNTTLAREQVVGEGRRCERCDTPVARKDLKQWFLATTAYADELLDFSHLDWPPRVQVLQENWIGRSEGARVRFQTEVGESVEVFTTRPDTLWGATFLVLAPEHPLVERLTTKDRSSQVSTYQVQATRLTDVEREAVNREKTGVFLGSYAVNPANSERVPVWISDYVLMTYGTGAIMAVPAHDKRDFSFAHKHNLPLRLVVAPEGQSIDPLTMTEAVEARGVMVNSGELTGTPSDVAIERTIEFLEGRNLGRRTVSYRLRDWLISRQRYWGAPIPVVYCSECGTVPVADDDLPVTLPEDVEWRPTGESPLKLHPTWKETPCPLCGSPGERETDTFDTFIDSSWYHLRYLSPSWAEGPWDPSEYHHWMPVDTYTGGIEHATMHLIYTRFFHKALRDVGIIDGDEPMIQLRNQGIILGEDSEKMSKSRGNVVAPDELVDRYGADTVRVYLMFFSRWDQGGPWASGGIGGAARWLRRVWKLLLEPPGPGTPSPSVLEILYRKLHQTLQRVERDFEEFHFNTIISSLMELANEMVVAAKSGATGTPNWGEVVSMYLRMLAPVAPHISEELWHRLGYNGSVHAQDWPQIDAKVLQEPLVTLVVQINGKIRERLSVPSGLSEDEARARALASENVQRYIGGKIPKRVIVIPGRLVNIIS